MTKSEMQQPKGLRSGRTVCCVAGDCFKGILLAVGLFPHRANDKSDPLKSGFSPVYLFAVYQCLK